MCWESLKPPKYVNRILPAQMGEDKIFTYVSIITVFSGSLHKILPFSCAFLPCICSLAWGPRSDSNSRRNLPKISSAGPYMSAISNVVRPASKYENISFTALPSSIGPCAPETCHIPFTILRICKPFLIRHKGTLDILLAWISNCTNASLQRQCFVMARDRIITIASTNLPTKKIFPRGRNQGEMRIAYFR